MKQQRHLRLNSLSIKIFLICLFFIVVPMLINLIYTSYSASNALEKEASSSLTKIVQEKNKQVNSVFDLQFQISDSTVNEIFLADFFNDISAVNEINPANISRIAQNLETRLANSNGLYENIFLSYDDRIFIDGVGGGSVDHVFDKELEAYYYEQVQNPGVAASPYMYSPITGRPVIAVSNSIVDQSTNEVLSVLGIAVDISRLTEGLVEGTADQNVHTMILDPSGLVIASDLTEHTLTLNFNEHAEDTKDFFEQMNEANSGTGYFTLNGAENMASFVQNENNGLYILTYIPIDQYMGAVDSLQSGIILVILLSVLVSAICLLFYIFKLIKPIQLLSKTAQQIAQGDLTAEPLKLRNKDEIGDLAASFNSMLSSLREMITQVRITSEKVASASEELSAASEQSSRVSETITQSMQEVAAGSEQQSLNALNSSDLIKEVTAGVKQVTINSQNVSNASVETTHKAKDGAEIIDSSISKIEGINENIQEAAGKIKHLGERSKEIRQIVEVITQIANQTNLLALNAAIEAARAGEHGQGFAVVADEVRKLAEQSKQSSEQIKELVMAILGETEQTVVWMDGTVEQSAKGIQAIKSVEQTFLDIQSSVVDVTGQIQEVSSASQQMAAFIEQIALSVDQISNITSETAAQTQQVSASAEEQSASAEEITASAASLAKLADELQELIQKFKI
ncbi:methyl-accepting chemotaxis protein [Jeotgalibacillus soli]|uniref:Methyl-accepting chemotaxis protein n=1 Tax=Jeotgalibacillus soli TaxID=889306 RepID=A0A0C2S5K5_9BACL|nr:methyl-accepting chemotaxis protein [Jeotgalibacillus soli]KIL49329.1 hypothetical protein KP78_07970 [Jeotgalibacillus soli]